MKRDSRLRLVAQTNNVNHVPYELTRERKNNTCPAWLEKQNGLMNNYRWATTYCFKKGGAYLLI